jgi:hypothetical protein
MESLLKVDRLDGTFIGSASFQSSQCGEPTQRFMLHRCEPSAAIFESGWAQAQYRQIVTLMKFHFLVIGK